MGGKGSGHKGAGSSRRTAVARHGGRELPGRSTLADPAGRGKRARRPYRREARAHQPQPLGWSIGGGSYPRGR